MKKIIADALGTVKSFLISFLGSSVPKNMAATLEARLQYLETREESNTKEILKLKSENVELKTKVHDMTTGDSQTERTLREIDTRCRKLEEGLKEVFIFRGAFDSRLSELEWAMKRVKDNDDRLGRMEASLNNARQEMNNFAQSVTEKLNTFSTDGNIQTSLIKNVNDNTDKVSALEKGFNKVRQEMTTYTKSVKERLDAFDRDGNSPDSLAKQVKRQEQRVCMMETGVDKAQQELNSFIQTVTEKLEALTGDECTTPATNTVVVQSEETEVRIKALENKNATCAQSAVDVKLRSRQRMRSNVALRMDHCEQIFKNGGFFDASSCFLNPQAHGDYLLCVVFLLAGQGRIEMVGKIEGRETPLHLGNVDSESNLLSTCTRVVSLERGQKLWLQGTRKSGAGFIFWCRLYCCLL